MSALKSHRLLVDGFTMVLEAMNVSPVVISVPHDGMFAGDFFGLYRERENGIKGRDKFVWPVVKDISLSVGISAVRGMMPRHFIDYNRPPAHLSFEGETQTAFDDDRLDIFYQSYHGQVVRLLQRAKKHFGAKRLLIDFHGFAKQPPYGEYDLILGTDNRVTVCSEVDRDFASFMSDCGYCVFLPEDFSSGPREDWYSAGFTTKYYAQKYRVDCIQIELASKFRTREGADAGRKMSSDIAAFLNEYFDL